MPDQKISKKNYSMDYKLEILSTLYTFYMLNWLEIGTISSLADQYKNSHRPKMVHKPDFGKHKYLH